MRKSLLVMLIAAAVMLISAFFMHGTGLGTTAYRYQQHLEQASEADLGVCSVCGGKAEICTHLPLIELRTHGQKIPGAPIADEYGNRAGYETGDNGETEIAADFSAVSAEGVWHHADDPADEEATVMMRIRGNSSRWFDKSSYRLHIVRDATDAEKNSAKYTKIETTAPDGTSATYVEDKQELLGMNRGSEWALYGPFLDKTLIRNYMCMNIIGQISDRWVPEVRFCELMLDGEYRGVYLLMETIQVEDGRLELTKYDPNAAVFSYLVRIEHDTNPLRQISNFSYYTLRMEELREVELLYPGLANQTEKVKNFVRDDFSRVEQLIYSPERADGAHKWKNEVDLNSFADYYIMQEFLAVNDTFSASTYFYRDARGLLCAGPAWDYNNALDNFFQDQPVDEFILSNRGWFAQMMHDKEFVERVITRYRELRKGVLSEENLLTTSQQTIDWLGSAVDRNYKVWGYSFDYHNVSEHERRTPAAGSDKTMEDMNPADYETAVGQMTEYMVERGRWMDENIESLRQYCHPSVYRAQIME